MYLNLGMKNGQGVVGDQLSVEKDVNSLMQMTEKKALIFRL